MTETKTASPPLRELVLATLEQMGYSQGWLAGQLAMSQKSLSQILFGERPLRPEQAVQLEEVLGIHAEFLMGAYVTWALAFERGCREEALEPMNVDDHLMKGDTAVLYFPVMMTTTGPDLVTRVGMFMARRKELLDLTADNSDIVCTYVITIDGEEIGEICHRYGDGFYRLIELGLELYRKQHHEPSTPTP